MVRSRTPSDRNIKKSNTEKAACYGSLFSFIIMINRSEKTNIVRCILPIFADCSSFENITVIFKFIFIYPAQVPKTAKTDVRVHISH